MIVHCIVLDKFIPPFIDFLKRNFDYNNHHFLFLHQEFYDYGLQPDKQNIWITDFNSENDFTLFLKKADKLIIHGLWSEYLIDFLYRNAYLLKKSYWVMWGGDFYFPERQSDKKKKVIRKMGNLITDVVGDYELAKQWYKAKGKIYRSFMYPSNLYKDVPKKDVIKHTANILIGNSSNPTNNHIDALEKLKDLKDENIKIFIPLSYGGGSEEYISEVIKTGQSIFKDKFIPLLEYIPYEEYIQFLNSIDIAIFNVNRQQAMGNIITLLGMGKKVYIRNDTTMWNYFSELGIKIFNFYGSFSLEPLANNLSKENVLKIKNHFSEENLIKQLTKIFG